MKPVDVVEVEIEKLGILRNPIAEEASSQPRILPLKPQKARSILSCLFI